MAVYDVLLTSGGPNNAKTRKGWSGSKQIILSFCMFLKEHILVSNLMQNTLLSLREIPISQRNMPCSHIIKQKTDFPRKFEILHLFTFGIGNHSNTKKKNSKRVSSLAPMSDFLIPTLNVAI